jgi:hypothetical protein
MAISETYRPQSTKPRSTLRHGPTNPWSESNSSSLRQSQCDSLATSATTPNLTCESSWKSVVQWRAQAMAHRADADWLDAEAVKCEDALARMSFVACVLATAKTSTLEKVIDGINAVLAPVELADWAAVSAALHRYASHSVAASEINMTEALRLQQIHPSRRLAVLLWHLSNEATRLRLARHIVPGMRGMWKCGFSVSQVVKQILEVGTRKIPVDQFRGSRSDLPSGTLPLARVAQMTYTQAEDVLSLPQDWPTDLVRAAVDRLSDRLSGQLPVAQIAAAADWRT